jgi:hypothetical protein
MAEQRGKPAAGGVSPEEDVVPAALLLVVVGLRPGAAAAEGSSGPDLD